jgi:hypothetical protein
MVSTDDPLDSTARRTCNNQRGADCDAVPAETRARRIYILGDADASSQEMKRIKI